MRHEGRRPARASNRGVRYNGNYVVVERMTAIADSVGQYVRSAIVGTDPHTRVSEACVGCLSTATRAGDSGDQDIKLLRSRHQELYVMMYENNPDPR
jgi:hypothetical protein